MRVREEKEILPIEMHIEDVLRNKNNMSRKIGLYSNRKKPCLPSPYSSKSSLNNSIYSRVSSEDASSSVTL